MCSANQTICVGTLESLATTLYQLTTQLIECGLGLCGCNKTSLEQDIKQLVQMLDLGKCNQAGELIKTPLKQLIKHH